MNQSRAVPVETLLANVPLFRDLAPIEITRIAAGTHTVRAEKGTVLFQRGDPCVGFHIVVFGQVKLAFTSPQGSEKVVELIGAGGTFGEALMFTSKPYIVYAQTLADSLLLHVSAETVFRELDRDPQLARRMLAGMSRRLHGLMADVEAYSLRSATQRVIGYLLRLAEVEAPEANEATVSFPAQKGLIASRLNVTPEHFSRILHDLAAAGLINVNKRDIHLADVERLRQYEGDD